MPTCNYLFDNDLCVDTTNFPEQYYYFQSNGKWSYNFDNVYSYCNKRRMFFNRNSCNYFWFCVDKFGYHFSFINSLHRK